MIKEFLTTCHRWLGFPVGILFIITFGTGLITAIDELSVRVEQALVNNNNHSSTPVLAIMALFLARSLSGKIGYLALLCQLRLRPTIN